MNAANSEIRISLHDIFAIFNSLTFYFKTTKLKYFLRFIVETQLHCLDV